ncbi:MULTISPECIES: pyridoxine 5'-phosphate synthase [unclassified Fibrobacter]|uniref:pyridoxine 5'-phosphate synthase n=1 Tax=unclassified Fibrobacter TaxID=2634177 RepID=UPI00092298EB|nr:MULTISPECIES: pyridoxine 5'-phosphate synthase [Fibrobacter]MDO4948363.1 pyridoxine 5'-phosphate synthase [Fibrobacter sp.]MCL4102213.1 Pyridoxine 5'-phosphate synthase [Fibrobacter succinogenes]OWV02849.1 pyridoxine 5'-phosphate synthase [Fibrobacter sp. UWH3]OWV08816.1 pyridoxine 5'-phosphate synthase [Fibrobacter sp. UWH1]SHK93575.1 pyridoxine 5'-phosphate synthase [Fibrobacter sp. UWH5]
MTVKLGFNVDHIATIREARKICEPDPVAAAVIAELAGVSGITAHLREDKRHIQDRDVRMLRGTVTTKMNLEMAPTQEMVQVAINNQPDTVTFVPEVHTDYATEDGLNVAAKAAELAKPAMTLKSNDIAVGVFIDPETEQVKAAKKIGADFVEFNTGKYATSCTLGSREEIEREISALEDMAVLARKYGLRVKAGRGLNYRNISAIAAIEGIDEVVIGHSIVSKAVMVGMDRAIKDMLDLIKDASK